MAGKKVKDTRYKNKPSTRTMRIRIMMVFGFVILGCIVLTIKIIRLDKNKGDDYTKRMLAQQSYTSAALPYKRGDIVDTNGNKLATSVKVYNLFLDPLAIRQDEDYLEPTKAALKKVFGISGEDVDDILEKNPTSRYYLMKDYKGLDSDQVDEMTKLQEEDDNIKGIYFEEEYQRQYPYSTVACDVIGFCSETNSGSWGIEKSYNDMLNGTNGRQYGYYDSELNLVKTIKAATNGYIVKSTIDVNVQGIMEQHMQKFMKNIGAKRVACLLMNPNTGGVIAMGSNDTYDLNNPRDLTVAYTQDEIDAMSDEEQVTALNELWRNYCISDSYEPGSTFKSLTVSACLDEGKTNKNRTYNCDGGQQVADRYIKCVANSYGGHGVLTVGQALMVSCNDVLMQLASSLGKTKFLDYMDAFGIGKKTGIDLPGEATGTVFDSDSMHATQLATSSFGQSQTVTMVQMAAAFSAVVNGGNYYRPHVVEEVTSESGAVIWSGSDALQSKVITEDTSKLLRKYLLAAVEDGTASPAQVKGYKVGGKTGTAEKIPRGQGKYLVSFIGCVPANNPELVIYVVIDEPNVADQAHSTYATEFASDLMKDILPLLEIYPSGKKSSVTKASKLTLPSTAKKNLDVEAPADGYVDGDETVAEDASAGEEGDTGVDESDTDTKESTEETTEETDETTEDSDE